MTKALRHIKGFFTLRTLLSRIWWAVFIFSMASVMIYISTTNLTWLNFVDLRAQVVYSFLGEYLAQRFRPFVDSTLKQDQLISELKELSRVTTYDVYLYDAERKNVFSRYGVKQVEFDLHPLKQFLKERDHLSTKIEIDSSILDASAGHEKRIFSAAPIAIEGREGYVIAIIAGREYVNIAKHFTYTAHYVVGARLVLVILLVSTLCGMLVYWIFNRRLKKMFVVVSSFDRGNYEARIDDHSPDELGEYSRAFDRMANSLVSNLNELQRQDKLRRELVANVAHELRRPLTLLSLALQTAELERETRPDLEKTYLDRALNECESLNQLINNLFELSKLEATEKTASLHPCALQDLLREVVEKFASRISVRELTLQLNLPEELPLSLVDPVLIDRALSNLLENAVTYNHTGGFIDITLTEVGNDLQLLLENSGPDVMPAEHGEVFQRFYRGTHARRVNPDGAGLGLAIVKRIIDIHGGRIQTCRPRNTLATFALELVLPSCGKIESGLRLAA